MADTTFPAHHESVIKATFKCSVDTSDESFVPLKTFVINHRLAVAREEVKFKCDENHIYVCI